jgi:hypothetical protein
MRDPGLNPSAPNLGWMVENDDDFNMCIQLYPEKYNRQQLRGNQQERFVRNDTIRCVQNMFTYWTKAGYFSIPFMLANQTNLELV